MHNILVLGGGGREHALCWKLRQSPLCGELYCAGGNAGIADVAQCPPAFADDSALLDFCAKHEVGLVIPASEAHLLAGAVDAVRSQGILAFGPTRDAAILEGSKGWTKALCTEYDIPTAAYRCFDDAQEACAYAETQPYPLVVKADGIAAGKGVIIAHSKQEAREAIGAMFGGRFGAAGARVVLEECLVGPELSFFALCDGTTALPFMTAQDYKRIGAGDTGANTGGMGVLCPSPRTSAKLEAEIMERIIAPTMRAMRERKMPFAGVLYAGLMLCPEPKLIEYNVRFGDPECQAMLPRLRSDLLPLLLASAQGQLAQAEPLQWAEDKSVLVVAASKGYPEKFAPDTKISGLKEVERACDHLFHAATKRDGADWRSAGGRVLNIIGRGNTLPEARQKAYNALEKLDWAEGYYRPDIGKEE